MSEPNQLLPLTRHPDDVDELPPRCPLGLRRRLTRCLGYYERGPGRLQLRALMRDNEQVCTVLVEAESTDVTVHLVICRSERLEDRMGYDGLAEERTHVYLKGPLNGRTVIDQETGEPVPLYVPTWHDGKPTKAPGYYTDPEAALAGWELLDDGTRASQPRHDAPPASRTLGY